MAAQSADIQALTNAIQALQDGLSNLGNAIQDNTNAIGAASAAKRRISDIPIFRGDQDPVSWLDNFICACNANGIQDTRKLTVIPAHLKGAASTWWTANQALLNSDPNRITHWTGQGNNHDFTQNFPDAFRTETLVEIWTIELDQRRQQPGESVTDYASALQELYRRVETRTFQYPEAHKARRFVNRLLPDLYVTVKPHNDQTWVGAVNRAESYELTHKDQIAVAAYLNKFTPVGKLSDVAQNETLTKAIQELTKQLQNFNARTQKNNYYRPRNYNQNFQQAPGQSQQKQTNGNQLKFTCYTCGQSGHISRNCPNKINSVPPLQPVTNNYQSANSAVNNAPIVDAASFSE